MSIEDKILGIEEKKKKIFKDKSDLYFANDAVWELYKEKNKHYIIVTGQTMKTFMPLETRSKVYEGQNKVSFNGYIAKFIKNKQA